MGHLARKTYSSSTWLRWISSNTPAHRIGSKNKRATTQTNPNDYIAYCSKLCLACSHSPSEIKQNNIHSCILQTQRLKKIILRVQHAARRDKCSQSVDQRITDTQARSDTNDNSNKRPACCTENDLRACDALERPRSTFIDNRLLPLSHADIGAIAISS